MLHAASIVMTVVLAEPVAILQASRRNALKPSAWRSSLGWSSGAKTPCRKSGRASVRKMIASAASRCAKNKRCRRPSRFQYSINSRVVRVVPGRSAARHSPIRSRIRLTSANSRHSPRAACSSSSGIFGLR
jgi:hypothetical protein